MIVVFAVLIGFYLVQFNRILMWPFQQAAANYPDLVSDVTIWLYGTP